jgi:transposase
MSDKIKSKLDKLKTKKRSLHGVLRRKIKMKIKNLTRQFNSVITKPTRITEDLHYKTSLFLVKNFETILIPEFSSKEVAKKLYSSVNRNNYALSHYKFRKRLIDKAKQWNRTLHIVPEGYTSVTCTVCGDVNERNKSKILKCRRCNVTMDRDLRGARNIFIKSFGLFKSNKNQ